MTWRITYVDLGDGLFHDLFTSIVDQDIKPSVFTDMLRDELLAVLGIHDVKSKSHTFLTILLDGGLDSLGTDWSACSSRKTKKEAYSSSSSGR